LTVRVSRDEEWRIDFEAEGRVLTSSEPNGIGIVDTEAGQPLHIRPDRPGCGRVRLRARRAIRTFVKNGQTVDIWNEDGGTSSEQAYKNVPFYLTNRGYGIFVNHPGRVSFEVASETVSRVQFSVEGQEPRVLRHLRPEPKEILEKYTALTGRPALPPAWSFGLWLSTSFTTVYDEPTVTASSGEWPNATSR
jgi:alpha-D-xyloside xylohydrolase